MSVPLCVFIWILAALGFFELLFAAVSFLFLAPEETGRGIVELSGHMENAEFLIRSALLSCRGTVYIIDSGADSETLAVAEFFANESSRVIILCPCHALPVFCKDIPQ